MLEIDSIQFPALWTAVLEVVGQDIGDYSEIEAAYVRGVVFAHTQQEATDLWRRGLDSMGFDLVRVDECESLTIQLDVMTGNEELDALRIRALRTRLPEFGAFHTWDEEDGVESGVE